MTTLSTPIASHTTATQYALRLHRIAAQSNSVDSVLAEAVRHAVATITPVVHAGATVVVDARHGVYTATAATTHVPTLWAALEDSHREGPCRDAIRSREIVAVHDFATDSRWPTLRRDLQRENSARSCVVVPMKTATDEVVGALALYADDPDVFTDDDIAAADSVATFAALAVATVQRSTQFETALASRDVIGQAKGMVMERFTVSAEQAFCLLTKLSQDSNIRVADIAVRLIAREHSNAQDTSPAPRDHRGTR